MPASTLHSRPPIRTLFVLALAGLLAACSAVKLAYNHVDELIFWSLDDYIGFEPAQSALLRAQLGDWHKGHRRQTLPDYARWLRRVAADAPAPTDAAAVCRLSDEARDELRKLAEQFVPLAARMTPGMGDDQLDRLRQRMAEKNADWKKEWMDRDTPSRDTARLKRMRQNVERFYGRLDAAQEDMLRLHIAQLPFEASLFQRESQRRQGDVLTTLTRMRTSADAATREYLAREWVNRWSYPADAELKGYLERSGTALCQTLARLHNAASTAQRAHLADTLRDYAQDLEALARQLVD